MTMTEWAKGVVLRLANVPAEPQLPEGGEGSVRVFRAGRNYFLWLLILWGLGNVAVALGLFGGFLFGRIPKLPGLVRTIWQVLETVAALTFLASIPVTYFLQKLNYEMRWYIVTDRSLRIRSGVVWLQEMTMTFANIQEIRVRSNPLERVLGLANVEVRSAGGGADAHGVPASGHVGVFEGVEDADGIRDLMVERLRAYRDSGLGEKTEQEPIALAAAREVLRESRSLRESVARGYLG